MKWKAILVKQNQFIDCLQVFKNNQKRHEIKTFQFNRYSDYKISSDWTSCSWRISAIMQCSSQHTIEIEIFSETDWLNAFKILYVCLHNILRERFLGNMIQFSSAFSHKYLVTEIIIKAPNVSLILDTSRPSIRRPWHDTWTIPHNEPKPKAEKNARKITSSPFESALVWRCDKSQKSRNQKWTAYGTCSWVTK